MPGTLLNSVDGLELIKTAGCVVGAIVSFPEETEALEIQVSCATSPLPGLEHSKVSI